MKIGMPSLVEFSTIEENIELCNKLNFDFIELNMNFPYNMIDSVDSQFIKDLAKSNNIYFTMHMPDDADIGSFYECVRQGYLNLFLDTIEWCKNSNIHLINMHINKGPFMTLPDKKVYIYEKYCDEYVKNFIYSISIIAEKAMKCGVTVCIENSNNFMLPFAKEIIKKSIIYDNVKLTWDVGHDYKSGYLDKKILLQNKDKIKHMHLHDANIKSDHLVLFEGDIDIMQRIKFAYDNNLSMLIEVKTKEALEKSKKVMDLNI
ncbi:sugar phosphate isomerase/epimerase [Sedimentibacter sp. zth1]|uniref:sugar phosphate isomerase/epimerase family protein n=1 Tax=Sedimentibacter sp. zth1 TaxID=2816908 RepID=UPI001A91F214|nr:sugar phosphate isomerase/epimerase family protein [Sedimentibacter sp. zth1]QSX04771.1 sugar phosphate isomerase/epimerase [Sedimentibacter sp. zth1]